MKNVKSKNNWHGWFLCYFTRQIKRGKYMNKKTIHIYHGSKSHSEIITDLLQALPEHVRDEDYLVVFEELVSNMEGIEVFYYDYLLSGNKSIENKTSVIVII